MKKKIFPEANDTHSACTDSRHSVASGHISINGENNSSQGSTHYQNSNHHQDQYLSELPTLSVTKATTKMNPPKSSDMNISEPSAPNDQISTELSSHEMIIDPEKVYEFSDKFPDAGGNCHDLIDSKLQQELPEDSYPVVDAMIIAMKSNLFPPFVVEDIPHDPV